MVVRLEKIRKSQAVLVIDENSKYIGQIDNIDFFIDCIEDRDPFEEDGYTWYFVNKECLLKLTNKK